jgi:hypothetical protein
VPLRIALRGRPNPIMMRVQRIECERCIQVREKDTGPSQINLLECNQKQISNLIFELLGVGWVRRTSKIEILLHKKSTMSSENDETGLEKAM